MIELEYLKTVFQVRRNFYDKMSSVEPLVSESRFYKAKAEGYSDALGEVEMLISMKPSADHSQDQAKSPNVIS